MHYDPIFVSCSRKKRAFEREKKKQTVIILTGFSDVKQGFFTFMQIF